MSPRLTDEQLDEMENAAGKAIEGLYWNASLGALPPSPAEVLSALSEVRRARKLEPWVNHFNECHLVGYAPSIIQHKYCDEFPGTCPGCTCGLSALEATPDGE